MSDLVVRNRLVFGNGFDLACKLSTKYSDFFNSKFYEKGLIFSFIKFANLSINDTWDSSNYFKPYSNYKNINIWCLFFYLCSINIYLPKVDLSSMQERIDDVDDNLTLTRWCDVEEAMRDSFIHGKNVIHNQSTIPLWSNIENFLKNKTTKSSIKTEAIIELFLKLQIKEVGIINNLYDYLFIKLKEFEKVFGEFISSQIQKCGSFVDDANTLIKKIVNDSLQYTEIDTFNYTTSDSINCYHINGSIKYPIFGIDSKGIDSNTREYFFTKTFRRFEYNKITLNVRNFTNFANLYIYGHSLNEQDFNYFFPIFDYLKINDISSKFKITFAYSTYEIKGKSKEQADVIILNKLVSGIANLFSSYEKYCNQKLEYRLIDQLSFNNRLVIIKIE